ncbi:MAG: hypothetical protein IJ223_01240 [Clostridia bacterium]|nr:hypothetical protein [Clostridia bacterium]
MFDDFLRVALLMLQVLHIFILGLALLMLYRYHNGEEYALKAAALVGLVSVPFALMLFGIMYNKGEVDTFFYVACISAGLFPPALYFRDYWKR